MKGNAAGDYLVDRAKDMACFDHLPLRIREVLRNTIFDIGAPQVRSTHNRLGVNRTIAEIRRIDVAHAAATRIDVWGASHP